MWVKKERTKQFSILNSRADKNWETYKKFLYTTNFSDIKQTFEFYNITYKVIIIFFLGFQDVLFPVNVIYYFYFDLCYCNILKTFSDTLE